MKFVGPDEVLGSEILRRPMVLVALLLVTVASAFTSGCASTGAMGRSEPDIELINREKAPDTLLRRGKALVRLGDTTRAVQYLTAALQEGEPPEKVLPVLLPVLIEAGRYRVAIVHARQYVENHPSDVKMRFLLGTLYRAVGRINEAIDEFEQVVTLDPKHADAHFALGELLRQQGRDLIEADRQFRIYLKLHPNGPRAERARASLLGSVP